MTLKKIRDRISGSTIQRNAMGSILIYCDDSKVDEGINSINSLHINLWNSRSNKLKYLDFGFMLDKDFLGKSINIVLPFVLDKTDICDLATEMIKDPNLGRGIFNANIEYKATEPNYAFVFNPEKSSNFCIQAISDFDVQRVDNQSVINVSIPKAPEKTDVKYLRFRIQNPYLGRMLKSINPKNRSFESAFITNEVIDFRVNDLKIVSTKNLQLLQDHPLVIINTHFLYMIDADEDVTLTGSETTSRFLENTLWNNYLKLSKGSFKKQIIAYHLKSKNNAPYFLIKNQVKKASKRTIFTYIAVVVVLSVFANLISPGIGDLVDSIKDKATYLFGKR